MNSTPTGSPTDGKKFLDGYIEDAIKRMQVARIPSGFDQATKGEIANDIQAKVAAGQIVV